MKICKLAFLALAPVLFFASCSDDDDDNKVVPSGGVGISFVNYSGNNPFFYDSVNYTSPGNQQYTITDLKYYISNVRLSTSQNTYTQTESYHLVKHGENDSKIISLNGIQPGVYTSLTFAIGVDSARNHDGAQTGALDPANGMLWDWNTGYKFLQFEGKSPASPQPSQTLLFHVGRDENYREVTIPLSPALEVKNGTYHSIVLKADINRMFGTAAEPVLFNEVHTVMGIGNSTLLANNYAQMFSLLGIAEAIE